MSYRKEKIAQENTKKRLRSIAVGILCALIAAACVFSSFVPAESWKYYFDLPKLSQREVGELRAHFMDVEEGNCVLLELPDGKNVIVGGGANDGTARGNVFRFLNALKIKKIDALIVPNSTANGVGILRELVDFYDVEKAYLPIGGGTNAEYSAFVADLSRKGIPAIDGTQGMIFGEANGYQLRILLPHTDGDASGDMLLSLSYCGMDFLLGDGYDAESLETLATEKRIGLWEKWGVEIENFDVIQTSRRVSAESFTAFAQEFGCTSAIFSCRGGEGCTPSEEVLTAVGDMGINAYRTDVHGYISISIRGANGYSVNTQKS